MTCSRRYGIKKSDLTDVENFYGNGVVYISDGQMVAELPYHNFDIDSLENRTGIDYWLSGGVVVALGACTDKSEAIRALKRIAKRIAKTPKKKFNPLSPV